MFHKSHLGIGAIITLALIAGVYLGRQAAVQAAPLGSPERLMVMTDLRHPVEQYLIPPFIRDLPAAYEALGLTVYPEDRVVTSPDISFGLGGQLYIERALVVKVSDAGQVAVYRTWREMVGDVLSDNLIELGAADRVEPGLTSQLDIDTTITITRVSVTEVVKHESIPYATQTVEDPNRPRGEKQVTQKGVNGTKALTYAVTRENGAETSRKLIKTETETAPTPEIVSIGTRVKTIGQGKATWYDPPWSGYTAAHNSLPKGTIVDVVNVTNGRRVTVKINDHGIQGSAIIDLSKEAFADLAPLGSGVIQVKLEIPG